jgi:hypothetical protein
MFLVIKLSLYMFRAMMATKLRPHTQDHAQYGGPTVEEHDHRWDSQQDFNYR